MQSPYIYGIHDPGGEHLLQGKGWVLFTEAIGCNPNDKSHGDYRHWADQGLGVIVRLNNGYEPEGTIPAPTLYRAFAQRCAAWVANSPGCSVWIIGNEPNAEWERPGGRSGTPITPTLYGACYQICRDAILDLPGHENDQVLIAAVAPWNDQTKYPGNETGDWVRYFVAILTHLGPANCSGIALHTYTHTADPALIYEDRPMAVPFAHRQFEFRAYRDFMHAIPAAFKSLPVYITETDQDQPWYNGNNGWVQRAYGEIDHWNQHPTTQKIRSLILYRWPSFDKWAINDKPGVHADLTAALSYNYRWDTAPNLPISQSPSLQSPSFQSPVSNLQPGTLANVAAAVANVRIAPGLGTSVIGSKYKGDVVKLHRSEIVDGITWWDIQPGWMAEKSQYNVTILEPYSPTPADSLIDDLSRQYTVDARLIRAVIAIESGGNGFAPDGKLIIRFEPHVFRDQLPADQKLAFAQHFQLGTPAWDGNQHRVDLGSGWRQFHGNQDLEWMALKAAGTIDQHAAYCATSMGAPQIMGFHYARLGYPSPMAMKDDFATGEPAQIRALFSFLESSGAIEKLCTGDLVGFATIYNGPGQAQHYAQLIENAIK